MSLDDLTDPDGTGIDYSMTVQDLVSIYGKEAVKRGIQYMGSLSEAEENYRESVTQDKMEDGFERIAESDIDLSDEAKEASSRWEQESKESGLGIGE